MKIKTPTKASALGIIARHIAAVQAEETKGLTRAQQEKISHWSAHPWNFISGEDVDGTPVYWTRDEKDSKEPVKPFPKYAYLEDYVGRLHEERIVLVDKARQLIFSTATLAYASWQCLFLEGRRWILSRSKEDDAKEMLKDKIRAPLKHTPKWFQDWARVTSQPEIRVDYRRTGSYILAATQNVAQNSARGGSASGFIVDEAAFQDMFGSIFGAAEPMTDKLFAISTPPDEWNQGAEEFYRMIDDTAEA